MSKDNADRSAKDLWDAVGSLQERVTLLEAAVRAQQLVGAAKPVASSVPPPPPQWAQAETASPAIAAVPVAKVEPPPLPVAAAADSTAATRRSMSGESMPGVLKALADVASEVRATPPAPRPSGVSLEQRLGTRWMLLLGVGVFILGIVFFFKYMADMGWVNEGIRLILGTAVGILLLGLGEYSLRRNLRLFAAGISATGIIVLYIVIFVASPNGMGGNYQKLTSVSAFGLMCVVTVLGVGVALRNGLMLSALLSLLGAMATPVLLSTHKNQEVGLMTYLLAVNAGFLVLALARRWQALAPVALFGTAVLVAGWFASFGSDSPWGLTSFFGWSLWGMFVIYAIAAARKQRALPQLAFWITAIASVLVVVLWLELPLPASWRLGQALALTAIMLTASLLQRWWPLALVSLALTIAAYAEPGHSAVLTCTMAWASAGLFFVSSLIAARLQRFAREQCISLVGLAGLGLAILWLLGQPGMWLELDLSAVGTMSQLLALNAVVLGICLVERWHALRAGVVIWSVASVGLLYVLEWLDVALDIVHPVLSPMSWCLWIWGFYALFMADIFVRAWWRAIGTRERLDAWLTAIASVAMFASTYLLLRPQHHDWMGFYAAALGVAYLAATWAVRYKAQRPVMAYTILASGLALFTVAIPIQFKLSTITFAWSIQAVLLMLLARRTRSVMLAVNSLVVVALAVMHLYVFALPRDARLETILLAPLGVHLTQGLALGICVSAAALLVAGLLRWGKALRSDDDENTIAVVLVVAAGIVFGHLTARLLPVDAATWWWLGFIAVLGAVAVVVRSRMLSVCLLGAILWGVAKWVCYDTLGLRIISGPSELGTILNWRVASGVVMAAALLVYVRQLVAGPRGACLPGGIAAKPLAATLVVMASALVLWAGTFEIERYFALAGGATFANAAQAMQMGLSLWWSLYAVALLVIGFATSRASLRYFAIVIFAVAVGKVFLVDMQQVQAIYRILSFMGLGSLLLAGSWFYNRYFRPKTRPARDSEPQA